MQEFQAICTKLSYIILYRFTYLICRNFISGTPMTRTMIRARPAPHQTKTYAQQLQELQKPATVKPHSRRK